MTAVSPAELISRVQAELDRRALDCQRDPLVCNALEVLINKVMSLHDYASLTEQAHATFDLAPSSDFAMARQIALIADNTLISTCVDVAALALHIASTVELPERPR